MDSTTIIYYTCMYCNTRFRVIKDNGNNKYCCDEHRILSHKERVAYKQKIKRTVMKELEQAANNKTVMSQITKWYKMMNMEESMCAVCGKSFEDNLIEWGVPLHMEVQDPKIRDYRLMSPESWLTFCTRCFLEIRTNREEDK